MTLSKIEDILETNYCKKIISDSIILTEKDINAKLYKIKLNCHHGSYLLLKLDANKSKHFCKFIKYTNNKYHKLCDYAILFIYNNRLKIILCELKSNTVTNKNCIYKFKSSENAIKYLIEQLKIDNDIEKIQFSRKIIFCIDYKNKKVLKKCIYPKNQCKCFTEKLNDDTNNIHVYCVIEACPNKEEFNLSKYFN